MENKIWWSKPLQGERMQKKTWKMVQVAKAEEIKKQKKQKKKKTKAGR